VAIGEADPAVAHSLAADGLVRVHEGWILPPD
jgi:hypothetical protein